MPGPPFPSGGVYTRCPLCGGGEAGSEHSVVFCPAIHEAWTSLSSSTPQWWLGWLDHKTPPSQETRLAIRFNHAIAFLATSLGHNPVSDSREGTRLLAKQVLQRQDQVSCVPLDSDHHLLLNRPDNRKNQWSTTPQLDRANSCLSCGHNGNGGVRTWHGKHAQRAAYCQPEMPRAALVATETFPDGEQVLTLSAHSVPAAWPFGVQGPMGWPVEASQQGDNIRWTCFRCPQCSLWKLTAHATREIETGDLLRGPAPPQTQVLLSDSPPRYLVAFDGGARHKSPTACLPKEGPRAAGAGAILWGPVNNEGHRPCLAQALVVAPWAHSSMTAEALGLRAALALTTLTTGHPGELCVVGDNLPIMRMAASNGKVRTRDVWHLLDEPLGFCAVQGWTCRWAAVRRNQNKAADALATIATLEAVGDAAKGNFQTRLLLWTNSPSDHGRQPTLLWHEPAPLMLAQPPFKEQLYLPVLANAR